MNPWTPLIVAASAGAFGLCVWFLSLLEGWLIRTVVVLGTFILGGLGWLWVTKGAGMVVLTIAGICVVGLLIWMIRQFVEMAAREREKREQDEQNKRWIEEEKQARARRQEEQDKRRAEERRQEDARRAAEDEARRAKERREAEDRRQKEELERYRAEERRRKLEAAEVKLAEVMKDADPDTPMF